MWLLLSPACPTSFPLEAQAEHFPIVLIKLMLQHLFSWQMKMSKRVNTSVASPPQILSASVKGWPWMKQEHCQAGQRPDDAHLSWLCSVRGILEPQILLSAASRKNSSSYTCCSALASALQWSSSSAMVEALRDRHYQCNYLSALFTLEFILLLSLVGACFQLDAEQNKDLSVPKSWCASTKTFNLYHPQCRTRLSFGNLWQEPLKKLLATWKIFYYLRYTA